MALHALLEIPASVRFREVDGQMVLVNVDSEAYYGLNDVGVDIITRLTSQPFGEAFSALSREYDVAPALMRRDIDDLVDALVQAGLVHRVEQPLVDSTTRGSARG